MSMYFVLLALVLRLSSAAILSDYVTVCNANDPKIDECVRTSVQSIWPRMIKGIKDLGIIPLEPMLVPLIQIQKGDVKSGGLSVNLTSTRHYGWNKASFKNFKVDPRKLKFEFEVHYAKYIILGDYQIAGRVSVLPISGNGSANVTIMDSENKVEFSGRLEERGGKKYMKVIKLTTSLSVGKTYIRMDNLFGNKELSDNMNAFLNENSKELFHDIKPDYEAVTNQLYWGILDNFFKKVPYNNLFTNI